MACIASPRGRVANKPESSSAGGGQQCNCERTADVPSASDVGGRADCRATAKEGTVGESADRVVERVVREEGDEQVVEQSALQPTRRREGRIGDVEDGSALRPYPAK